MKRDDTPDLFAAPPALDIKRARKARDEGMQRVADHADRMSHAWNVAAFLQFHRYAERNASFMTEDVRVAAHAAGLPQAPDSRAWGPVAHRAVRAGIVVVESYKRQRSVTCHGSPKPVYRSLLFREVA